MSILIAYTDRWSVRAGGRIEVKVSCSSANYRADLVRIRSADPNPAGPGMLFEDVPAVFEGSYPGRSQQIHGGSHGVVPLGPLALPPAWTLSVRVQPWLLDGRPQSVLSWIGGKGLSLYVTATGAELRVGEAVCRVRGADAGAALVRAARDLRRWIASPSANPAYNGLGCRRRRRSPAVGDYRSSHNHASGCRACWRGARLPRPPEWAARASVVAAGRGRRGNAP